MSDAIPIVDILADATNQAAKLVISYFKDRLTPEYKSSTQDLVTKADVESQECIKKVITKRMVESGIDEGEIGFLGEEGGLYERGKYVFAIDPVDGTTNFASGIEYFVISIGCFVDAILQFGYIYEPVTETAYFSELGNGAFKKKKDGKPVRMKITHKKLQECMVATYLHADKHIREQELQFIADIYPAVRGIRLMGAGALDIAKVADNVFQISMFEKSNIWDIAAATLILRESGGVIVHTSGREIDFDLTNPGKNYPVVACHPDNLRETLKFISG
jgi:myo-inositol-1(or 4)-monophosphatase